MHGLGKKRSERKGSDNNITTSDVPPYFSKLSFPPYRYYIYILLFGVNFLSFFCQITSTNKFEKAFKIITSLYYTNKTSEITIYII